MNRKKIEKAVKEILKAIGENPERKDLQGTPRRVAEMYEEIFAGIRRDPAKELEVILDQKHDEIILLKDIPLYALCEHHLLPFVGKAHVAYIPKGGRVTGLSKLARIVDLFSRRLQVQERLTTIIADTIMKKLRPRGVMVVIEAEHLCYDEKTEILTKDGWKFFKNLSYKDKVAQVNPSTRGISFIIPRKIISYHYKGKMVRIKSLSLDLLVTPDHRIYFSSEWNFYNSKCKKWHIAPASSLSKKYIVIPRSGRWEGKDVKMVSVGKYKIDFDLFVKLFGIWVGEGCITNAGKRNFFVISQSPSSPHFFYIENLFKELLKQYAVKYIKCKGNETTIQFRIEDDSFYNYFKKFGKSKDKYIPYIIKQSSPKYLRLFLDWYIKGDGHVKRNGAFHLVSKSERLIDDLQEICVKLGIGATKQNNKSKYFRMETHKTKSGDDKWYSRLRPYNFSFVNYKGKVYCVTVPKGLILVRRKGRMAISGNCMSMRGIKKPGATTVTSAVRGVFKENEKTRAETLALIKG
jgi:GTP cyclohydrolase I